MKRSIFVRIFTISSCSSDKVMTIRNETKTVLTVVAGGWYVAVIKL